MELLSTFQAEALALIYWDLLVAIVVTSYIVVKLFKSDWITLHPKWITLSIAVFLSGVKYFAYDQIDVLRAIVSLSLAVIFYDYIVKVGLDIWKRRNPLEDK